MAAIILGQARAHPPAGSLGTDRARLRGSGLAGLAAGGPASGCPRPKASGERGRIGAPRSPLEDSPPPRPPPPTPGAGEVSGSGHGDSDLNRGRGGQRSPRPGEGSRGRPLPRPDTPQGQPRRPGPPAARSAAAKTRRGGSERARSKLLRGPAAELGMLSAAAVRQLGSSRSPALGARTPAAASRRCPPPPDSGKLRGVPGARPAETDTLQIRSNPVASPRTPLPPHPNPNRGGCGRQSAAAAGGP